MKKFLLVDDHIVVRSGINGMICENFTPCEIHEANDGDSAITKLKQNVYDLILMDIKMPKTDTLGLMEYIHIRYPEAKVLIFSMSSENVYARRFLKAGAKGFISKEATIDEIKKAISLILNGRKYISDSLAQSLAEESFSDIAANPFDKLTSREFEVVYLLLAGQTTGGISKALIYRHQQ